MSTYTNKLIEFEEWCKNTGNITEGNTREVFNYFYYDIPEIKKVKPISDFNSESKIVKTRYFALNDLKYEYQNEFKKNDLYDFRGKFIILNSVDIMGVGYQGDTQNFYLIRRKLKPGFYECYKLKSKSKVYFHRVTLKKYKEIIGVNQVFIKSK